MMTPRPSLIGRISHSRWFGDNRRRRIILVIVLAICAILTFFPIKYRAVISLSPTDPASLGLSGTLGQLGAGASVFGSQTAIDVTVDAARGVYVQRAVAQKLRLPNRLHKTELGTVRWLQHNVEVQSLRGGIIEISMRNGDSDFALAVVGAYDNAIRQQLGAIARKQTAYKRDVLNNLVKQSKKNFDTAQENYDNFRKTTKYGNPQGAISQVANRVPSLEAQIIAKEGQINTLRNFATDGNMQIRQAQADLAELERQLAVAKSTQSASQSGSLAQVVHQSTKEEDLQRELNVAKRLYYSYRRYLEGTTVEDLTSNANIRILEAPFIDPDRQWNAGPAALGFLFLLFGLAVEFYKIRPPVGDEAIA